MIYGGDDFRPAGRAFWPRFHDADVGLVRHEPVRSDTLSPAYPALRARPLRIPARRTGNRAPSMWTNACPHLAAAARHRQLVLWRPSACSRVASRACRCRTAPACREQHRCHGRSVENPGIDSTPTTSTFFAWPARMKRSAVPALDEAAAPPAGRTPGSRQCRAGLQDARRLENHVRRWWRR